MNQARWKQLVLGVIGTGICKASIGGCYPLIPAYFAAVYLEEQGRYFLILGILTGMTAFLPITVIAKYGMALLFTAAVIRLSEWANKRCYTVTAALAASGGTLALSVFGGIFDLKNRVTLVMSCLEAVFIFGFVILAARAVHLFLEEEKKEDKKFLAGEIREQRLLNYAKSFEGLSKMFLSMSRTEKEGEEADRLQQEITGRVCSDCAACAVCWNTADTKMYRLFDRFTKEVLKNGEADKETHTELKKSCHYAAHIEETAAEIFEKAQMNRAWYRRLLENRGVIAEQLDAMAYIMQDCAQETKVLDDKEKRKLSELRYRAKECGITAEEVHLYEKENGRIQAVLKVRSKWGGCVPVKNLTKAVSKALNQKMRPHKDARVFVGKETSEIIYEEEPLFYAVHGMAKLIKDGEKISGDSFSCMEKDDGELVLSISDGMGFGETANRESETVVDLLEKFIEAGFNKETAIRMMNSAMVLHGENEQFSTVDLASVNLYTGTAEFYKIGASATFIRHKNGKVECMLSTSLPAGVSVEFEIERATKKLKDGDFLVMVTDGVLEYLQEEKPEETMEKIISEAGTNHPALLAKKILEKVMVYTKGKVKDDMTVLAAAVWEN